MMESILKNTMIDRIQNAAVAGTSDTLSGDIVDLQGYDSAIIIAALGDVTNGAVVTLKAYCGDDSGLSDGAYKSNTAAVTATATSADNKLLVLDVVRPGKRYLRGDLVRATANAVVDGVFVIRYNSKTKPRTQGSDVVASALSVN